MIVMETMLSGRPRIVHTCFFIASGFKLTSSLRSLKHLLDLLTWPMKDDTTSWETLWTRPPWWILWTHAKLKIWIRRSWLPVPWFRETSEVRCPCSVCHCVHIKVCQARLRICVYSDRWTVEITKLCFKFKVAFRACVCVTTVTCRWGLVCKTLLARWQKLKISRPLGFSNSILQLKHAIRVCANLFPEFR